jgi:8-hydroxy-5-deazaflavin:NADPH oxidoreductase
MKIIGFLGGTGVAGKGLAIRLAAAGADVIIGSRSEERARAAAAQYNAVLGRETIRGLSNDAMIASSAIVLLTVPFDQAIAAARSVQFAPGQILVDVTVPVRFEKGRPEYVEQEGGLSGSEILARHLPGSVAVVGAFKTLPAAMLADLSIEPDCDEFICGDAAEARGQVIELARSIPTLRPVDAGPLRMARAIERMTLLAIQLNRLHKKHDSRYRMVGM